MDQFVNNQQVEYYDATRPKYTQEIFDYIINSIVEKGEKENYLDVACGSGQLLFPLSKYFNLSVGIDASEQQIKKAEEKLKFLENENFNKIHLMTCDAYDVYSKLIDENILKSSKTSTEVFDLITIGQAFHWFDEIKILTYLRNILKENGVLILVGYTKQHFDPNTHPELYKLFQGTIDTLIPYFECDIKNNDGAYFKSYENIKKVFNIEESEIKVEWYTESTRCKVKKVVDLLRSWSAYINMVKNSKQSENAFKDPIDDLQENLINYFNLKSIDDLEKQEVDYYNFYFTVAIKK